MSRLTAIVIAIAIYLLIDLYVFKGLKLVLNGIEHNVVRKGLRYLYWGITLSYILYLLWILQHRQEIQQSHNYWHFYTAFGLFVLLLIPKVVFVIFHLLDDILYGIMWLWAKLTYSEEVSGGGVKITRAVFLTRLGLILAAVPFFSILYGMLFGKFDFRIRRSSLRFPNLPEAFHGFTVVQISDAHLGSFFDNRRPVKKAIEMINRLQPDIVVFTGDMVNNYADEAEGWIPLFSSIKARYGKFSILGNHDYGEYVKWESTAARLQNLERLKEIHRQMGFRLLLNENVSISVNDEHISLVGVENWGKPPFPQYGKINMAMKGSDAPFRILLSHDPSHWDAQILGKQPIDLTLSGHTHGMQFGIEVAGLKWSPVKYRYPRWGGLYTEKNQHLYVNRGFGVLVFPGRVGMPPEITHLELYRS